VVGGFHGVRVTRDEIEEDGTHWRIVYSVKVTSGVVIAISSMWLLFALVLGHMLVVGIAGAVLLGTLFSLFLVLAGYPVLGRVAWYLISIIAVTFAVFTVHPVGHAEALYAALLGGPFLTFSVQTERRYIMVLVPLVFVVWLATRYMGHDYFGPPLLDEGFSANYVSFLVLLTSFLIITFEMAMFAFLMQRYVHKLYDSRKAAFVANHAKSEFLAAMSHEIRTPMNGVIGMVEILGSTPLSADQQRILTTIRDSSFSLLRIIEDILDMSKIEAGKLALVNEETDLLNTVEGVVDTLRAYADANNVRLLLHYDCTLPRTIMADAGRLRQIMLNLLGNAIKFSRRPADEAEGQVCLEVWRRGPGQLRLVFRDDGIGIAPEFLEQLFQPFQQSEAVTTRRYGGSGLGLAIVHQLVSKMQRQVRVKSALAEGAEFTVDLPMAQPSGSFDMLAGNKVCFAVYQAPQPTHPMWQTYLSAGADRPLFVETPSALLEFCARHGSAAVVIFASEQGEDDPFLAQLRRQFPNARVIALTRRRDAHVGQWQEGLVVIQRSPVLPSELRFALRVLENQPLAELPAAPAKPVPAPTSKQHYRILVAEDNEINQIVIQRQLEALGHDITVVENGAAAKREWLEDDFDIILTDCHMPEIDGFELTQRIRQIEARRPNSPRTPIIAITANALSGEEARCRAVGMDGYLSKPVKLEEMGQMIQALASPTGT